MSNESNTQDNGGQNDSGQTQSQEGAGNPGFQARIDQLTAARYEAEARAKAATEMQERLLAQLQAAQANQAPPPPGVDPLAELDPQLAKALQHVTAKFETQIGALTRQLTAQTQLNEIQQVAARHGVQDEAIKQRAAALAQGWAQKGMPINADDAMIFAAGEAALAANRQAPRDPLGRHQGTTFSGQAPRVQTSSQGPKPLPSNFDSLSPQTQEKLLKERGVDDVAF